MFYSLIKGLFLKRRSKFIVSWSQIINWLNRIEIIIKMLEL